MSRTASVRSASLSPDEEALANYLASALAGGSFTELTRMLLNYFGAPLRKRLEELRESGIDPNERLFVTRGTPADTDEQIHDFYAPSSWRKAQTGRE